MRIAGDKDVMRPPVATHKRNHSGNTGFASHPSDPKESSLCGLSSSEDALKRPCRGTPDPASPGQSGSRTDGGPKNVHPTAEEWHGTEPVRPAWSPLTNHEPSPTPKSIPLPQINPPLVFSTRGVFADSHSLPILDDRLNESIRVLYSRTWTATLALLRSMNIDAFAAASFADHLVWGDAFQASGLESPTTTTDVGGPALLNGELMIAFVGSFFKGVRTDLLPSPSFYIEEAKGVLCRVGRRQEGAFHSAIEKAYSPFSE